MGSEKSEKSETMQPIREKRTSSLNGAAYAVAKGVQLLASYRDASGRNTLVLGDDDGEATRLLKEFWDGEPLVHARTYAEARRYLLEMMNTPTPTIPNRNHTTEPISDADATATK